jgi:hypothetical protein
MRTPNEGHAAAIKDWLAANGPTAIDASNRADFLEHVFGTREIANTRANLGRITVRHAFADAGLPYGEGGEGRFHLPSRIRATVEPANPSFPLIDLEIVHVLDPTADPPRSDLDASKPQLVSVSFRRRPEGLPLAVNDVRRPLDTYMRWALEVASYCYVRDAEGRAFLIATHPDAQGLCDRVPLSAIGEAPNPDELEIPIAYDVAQAWIASFRTMQAREARAHDRNALDDDLLQRVATTYREARKTGRHPTKAVMKAEDRPRATASRWIRRAREKGFLGPAVERRAGEYGGTESKANV